MKKLRERFARLPRAMRWLVLAAVCFGVIWGIIFPTLDAIDRFNRRANYALNQLTSLQQQAERRAQADNRIARGTINFGEVDLPTQGGGKSNELFTRISEILKNHEIARPNVTAQRPIPIKLDPDTQETLAGSNRELQRVIFDIRIEGAPEAIAGVIADLEKTPQVTSISQIVLRRVGKPEERKLSATIMPEAWVVAERGGRR